MEHAIIMTTQLVKKNFGGKRKGYQGKKSHWARRLVDPYETVSSWFERGNAVSNEILA